MDVVKKRVLGWIVLLGILSHFSFWVMQYSGMGTEDGRTKFGILYWLSAYFCIDVLGLALFVVSSTVKLDTLRWLGAGAMLVASLFFYFEFSNPNYDNYENLKRPVVFALFIWNLFFIFYFTDKLRG